MRDIAKLAGVSVSTVSRVLNSDETIKVSLDTKKRIFEVAEQLSYQKHELKSSTIGQYALVHWYNELEELNDPFFLSIRLGIEQEFHLNKITLEKYFNNENGHTFLDIDKKYQGIIILGKFSEENIKNFSKKSENTILIHDISKNFTYDSVIVDFKQLTKDVLDKMLERDHKKIGFIGGREIIIGSDEILKDDREITFYEYMNQIGLFNDKYFKIGKFSYNSGYFLMKSLIDECLLDLPSCIFIASDTMAIGALRALNEANINVPDAISIISCNDIPASKYTSPNLSTVKIHTDFMGKVSAKLLINQSERDEKLRIIIPHELILRDTF